MNFLKKAFLKLGLIREETVFTALEKLPQDVIVIPEGSYIQGGMRTDLSVVVAGVMHGDLEIDGRGEIVVLSGGVVRDGAISAASILIQGVASDVRLDGDSIYVPSEGRLQGRNEITYGKFIRDGDADIAGSFFKRAIDVEPLSRSSIVEVAYR